MVLLLNGEQCDKIFAHKHGMAHYAFSVFVFNFQNELLLQKRAKSKYHSGGLWTNTCCSHPLTNNLKQIKKIAENRLLYEMGIYCPLEYIFEFEYKTQCGELIENEYDYVFVGYSNQNPQINTDEVENYKWDTLDNITTHRMTYPQEYTQWFKILLNNMDLFNKLNNRRIILQKI
jgi:isopentenyl-diphosphate delta-isomerase